MQEKGIVSASLREEERQFETALRPLRLADFAGQTKLKENLAIAIEARGLAGENLSPPPRLVDREVGGSFLSSVAGRPDVAVSLALSPPPILPR